MWTVAKMFKVAKMCLQRQKIGGKLKRWVKSDKTSRKSDQGDLNGKNGNQNSDMVKIDEDWHKKQRKEINSGQNGLTVGVGEKMATAQCCDILSGGISYRVVHQVSMFSN